MKQKIEILNNPITGKPTLCLQNWDTIEMVDGYTKEEAEILTLTHLDFQDFQVRLKIKLNNKYYTGILELSE